MLHRGGFHSDVARLFGHTTTLISLAWRWTLRFVREQSVHDLGPVRRDSTFNGAVPLSLTRSHLTIRILSSFESALGDFLFRGFWISPTDNFLELGIKLDTFVLNCEQVPFNMLNKYNSWRGKIDPQSRLI